MEFVPLSAVRSRLPEQLPTSRLYHEKAHDDHIKNIYSDLGDNISGGGAAEELIHEEGGDLGVEERKLGISGEETWDFRGGDLVSGEEIWEFGNNERRFGT